MNFSIIESFDTTQFKFNNELKSEKTFTFLGFGDFIHPYFKAQVDYVRQILLFQGIDLNIVTVPTVDGLSTDIDKGYVAAEDLIIPVGLKPSRDGVTYCLLRNREMGRGWSVLFKIGGGASEILFQGERSLVRDYLLKGDFIRSFGVNYEYKSN